MKFNKNKNKRGLSPVVATVLLISLAVLLALVVLMWALGWTKEQIEKAGKPIENLCKEAKIRLDYEGTATGIKVFVTNIGSIPISGVGAKIESKSGAVDNYITNNNIAPGATGEFSLTTTINNAKKITIYPLLTGNVKGKNQRKDYSCLSNSKVLI